MKRPNWTGKQRYLHSEIQIWAAIYYSSKILQDCSHMKYPRKQLSRLGIFHVTSQITRYQDKYFMFP